MSPSERADRLGQVFKRFGVVMEDTPTLADCGTADDLALANACLEVEQELRDGEWSAVQLLGLALGPPTRPGPSASPGGAPGPPTVNVPAADLARVARIVLQWYLPVPRD